MTGNGGDNGAGDCANVVQEPTEDGDIVEHNLEVDPCGWEGDDGTADNEDDVGEKKCEQDGDKTFDRFERADDDVEGEVDLQRLDMGRWLEMPNVEPKVTSGVRSRREVRSFSARRADERETDGTMLCCDLVIVRMVRVQKHV